MENSFSSMADYLVTVVMTHDLPKALEEEILELIHELYQFGGLHGRNFNP